MLTVPWPARPLPAVTHFDDDNGSTNYRVAAVVMRQYPQYPNLFLDTRYPVGIRIGDLNQQPTSYTGNVESTNFFISSSRYLQSHVLRNPQQGLFKRHSANPQRNGESILPIAVYRQQTANTAFPKVTGNLIQVTPLIENIPFSFGYTTDGVPMMTLYDLLFVGGQEMPNPTTNLSYLYVRDQQPVLIGASYHYYVVRFNAKHEVAETIDAGTVTIPPN